jgi:hypothetical protein
MRLDTTTARALLADIEHELRSFNAWWRPRAIWGSMYQLPELASVETPPTVIEVEAFAGQRALALAEGALKQLSYVPNQHHATALRFPGLVALAEDPMPFVARINQAKDRLQDALQLALAGENAFVRAKRNKELLPGVSILQATRHVGALSSPPYSFAFTWISKTVSRKHLTADEAVGLVEAQGRPAHLSMERWQGLVDAKIINIRSLPPSTTILQHRELAPHPRLLAILAKGQRPPATFRASLPVFFPLPSGKVADLPRITPLQNFDRSIERPTRGATKKPKLVELVSELSLYYVDGTNTA